MNKFRILLGVIFLLLFSISAFYLGNQLINKNKTQVCTQEAKICPDGSTVSRTGPNCEFAPCVSVKPTLKEIEKISVQPEQNKVSYIRGSIMVYHVYETSLVVQLSAESTQGKITDMQVWSDSKLTTVWQPFDTLATIPWKPNDQVYARFRDELGNISEVYSGSIHPPQGPPPYDYESR